MNELKDRSGQTFSRWTILSEAPRKAGSSRRVWVKCECGKIVDRLLSSIISGHSQSCGCLNLERIKARSTTHGYTRTKAGRKLFNSWLAMIDRCHNPKNKHYKNYGARGITVCERWRGDFGTFQSDMGERPKGLSLDRIDNNKGYQPGNCRWATRSQQNRNHRKNLLITKGGVTKTAVEWAEITGIPAMTIYSRHRDGWTNDELLMPKTRIWRKNR